MFKSRIAFHFNCYEDSPYIFVKTQFSLALTIFHLIDIECKFHISVYLLFCWIRDEWNVTDIFFSSSIIINIVFFNLSFFFSKLQGGVITAFWPAYLAGKRKKNSWGVIQIMFNHGVTNSKLYASFCKNVIVSKYNHSLWIYSRKPTKFRPIFTK